MSNRIRIKNPKRRVLRKNCPKCGKRMHGKEYPDKSKLWICAGCKFPVRADA